MPIVTSRGGCPLGEVDFLSNGGQTYKGREVKWVSFFMSLGGL